MSVSPPPGGASGRRPIGLTVWNSSPLSVERCTHDCCVDVPNGPDSQYSELDGTTFKGSPSVRCASTTVAGENLSEPAARVGVGVPEIVVGTVPPPPTGGSGAVVVFTWTAYVYGGTSATALPATQIWTLYDPAPSVGTG